MLNELLTLATDDIIHIKPILLKSGYSSILCFITTLNSSKFLVLILALFLCAHYINMPSAETRIKVALKRELALFDVCGLVGSYICSISFDVCEYSSTGMWWEIYQLATVS